MDPGIVFMICVASVLIVCAIGMTVDCMYANYIRYKMHSNDSKNS